MILRTRWFVVFGTIFVISTFRTQIIGHAVRMLVFIQAIATLCVNQEGNNDGLSPEECPFSAVFALIITIDTRKGLILSR